MVKLLRKNAGPFLFVFLLCSPGFSEEPKTSIPKASKIFVMIDAGHGGEDSGAQFKKTKEKDICLKVALELKTLLSKDSHFFPLMTRDRDQFIALDDRSKLAENKNATVFISIHANSSPVEKATGTEFYFENQVATDEESLFLANRENSAMKTVSNSEERTTKNSDVNYILTDLAHNEHIVVSQQLSQLMLQAFKNNLKVKTRAIRQAPFRVLSVGMPATLIELGFISNPKEAAWLSLTKTQKEAALAIYDGLKAFKVKLDRINRNPASSL